MKHKSRPFAEPGTRFPDFDLQARDGARHTARLLEGAPASLVAVFKADCPTSQFSLPYFNRLLEQVAGLPFVGVSQDGPEPTDEFVREWGAAFSLVLFEDEPYALSEALGITHVPSVFLVGPDRRILVADFGYSEKFWEEAAHRAAAAFGLTVSPIIPADAPRWALG